MFLKFFNKNDYALLTNSSYLYLSHFSDYLFTLFLLPFVARTLGAVELGKIGIVQIFGIFISLVMEFGSSLFLTREVARNRGKVNQIRTLVETVITFKITLIPISLFITSIVYFSIPIFFTNPHYILIVFLGSVFHGFAPFWYFEGEEKMKELALSKIMFRIIGFILILFFVQDSNDGWKVLFIYSLTSLSICIYLIISMIIAIGSIRPASISISIKLYNKATKSFLITIIPIIFQNVGIFMLSVFISPLQLGIFYGVSRIYRAFNSLFSPLSQSFYPLISTKYAKSKIESKSLIKNYLVLISSLGVLFMIVLIFFSGQIISLLLGDEYLSGTKILRLFALILPLTAVSNSLGRQWLLAKGEDSYYLSLQVFSCLFALIFFHFCLNDFEAMSYPLSLIIYESLSILLATFLLIKK